MGSVTRYRKRVCSEGYWTNWGTITDFSIIDSLNGAHCVYSANVSMSASEKLDSITFANTFASGITGFATFQFYLYTSDPSGASAPPGNYVGHTSTDRWLTTQGITESVSFTGLNLTGVTELYIWVTASYDNTGGWVYCCDDSIASQQTAITGSFSTISMTLSISPGSVTAGGSVVLGVTNGNGVNLTAVFTYGSTVLPVTGTQSVSFSSGSANVPCPMSWFDIAGVTTLQRMTVNVSVTGGPSTLTGSFTLVASDAMAPAISNVSASIVQADGGASSYYPNTYIAGLSKCKVSAKVESSTSAVISSVVLSYPGGSSVNMVYNSSTLKYEGTTAAPLTGNTVFTVTARDQRGLSTQATTSVSGVVAYTPPSVEINLAFRCNSSGVEESGGACWRIRATATFDTALSNNSLTKLTAEIEGGAENNLISGSTSGPLTGMTNPKAAYKVLVTVQDKVSGEITKSITLEGMSRNVVVTRSDDGTYMGLGTTPGRTSGPSAYELPTAGSYLIGGIPAQAFIDPVLVSDGSNAYVPDLSGDSFKATPTSTPDFLLVDHNDPHARENAAAFFLREGNGTHWDNEPSPMAAGGALENYRWRGYRTVLWYDTEWQLVLIVELFPYPGTIWSNLYNAYQSGNKWVGWRRISPTNPG